MKNEKKERVKWEEEKDDDKESNEEEDRVKKKIGVVYWVTCRRV
jgi:hypothetical protein